MTAFVDTSALYALLSRNDESHPAARAAFTALLEEDAGLITHNYVVVETVALVRRRLGLAAVAALRDDLLPVMKLAWVDRPLHDEALAAVLSAERRDISFVDRVSFELMGRRGLKRAFAFDEHFATRGFELVPPP